MKMHSSSRSAILVRAAAADVRPKGTFNLTRKQQARKSRVLSAPTFRIRNTICRPHVCSTARTSPAQLGEKHLGTSPPSPIRFDVVMCELLQNSK
ncbi:hypothetical protein JTE90_017412 [Oedothorax gibbosus]|uniref:Uncharacterized protein n=1 Tax=Oedothorax gibbosus TaxID=931172 RepID=A0AAV6U6R7_9ARAC|nr:hypothetical protein JTE90_017412 [Oedothorax gibbosus]